MVALMMFLCLVVEAQTTVQSQSDLGIFRFPLFERAVRCIKFYEGWHDIKRNYPYIGWGHCVQPHENFKKNLTLEQADSLLRSDLRIFWAHPTNPVEGCADANPKTVLPNDT